MKKHGWKILGALLVLYALVAGLLIPLKSGIKDISAKNAVLGKPLNLDIKGYNSHYTEAKEIQAWLKLDSVHLVKANKINVKSNQHLSLSFDVPNYNLNPNGVKRATLIIDNEIDGYSLLPNALELLPNTDTIILQNNWISELDGLHEKQGLSFPYRNILYETIRNLFYHVPLWFAMMIMFFVSSIYSILYLKKGNPTHDYRALAINQVGILYGVLGLITGSIWAKWTWLSWWNFDVKQNMSAIAMLVYFAYLVLRSSFEDYEKQARISSVYNIFAFSTLIPLLFIIPRMYNSLHPGNGGNPGFGGEDLDNTMRLVFYPAILGFTLLGFWMSSIVYRYFILREKVMERHA